MSNRPATCRFWADRPDILDAPMIEMMADESGLKHSVEVRVEEREGVYIVPYTGSCGDGEASGSPEFEFFIATGY